ncbi:MAG: YXWGXW repeat-containing protein [Acidobacteria bacterium]|nr:YXWGXW repeat-containing protein [Acidobacteriota bacterium]
MKSNLTLLAMALIAGGTIFAQPRVSIGVGLGVGGYGPGAYPPPAHADQYAPPCPGPGYTWVDGYWAPQDGRRVWIGGYWRAPYANGYAYRDRDDRDRDGRAFNGRGDERFALRSNGGFEARDRGRGFSNAFRR